MGIKLEYINKVFENEEILKNLSVEFPSDGVACLWGASGLGKTTIINILLGLEEPDSGKITGTENIRFSVVFQQDRLLEWISAKDNILAVNSDEKLCQNLLKELGLENDALKLPSELSGGMRQRVAIARALAYNGDIFILDEAFKGLDFKLKQDVMEIVKKYIKHKLCIFVTHDIDEIAEFGDFVYVLDKKPIEDFEIIDFKNCKTKEEKTKKLKLLF